MVWIKGRLYKKVSYIFHWPTREAPKFHFPPSISPISPAPKSLNNSCTLSSHILLALQFLQLAHTCHLIPSTSISHLHSCENLVCLHGISGTLREVIGIHQPARVAKLFKLTNSDMFANAMKHKHTVFDTYTHSAVGETTGGWIFLGGCRRECTPLYQGS